VRTTISSQVQNAALAALGGVLELGRDRGRPGLDRSGPGGGAAPGPPALPAAGPLAAKLTPGTAFTIVSAAALLSDGVTASTQISCENSFTVGGQTFTSDGDRRGEAVQRRFRRRLRHGVRGLSERLTTEPVRPGGNGLRDRRELVLPAGAPFSGSVPSAAGRGRPGRRDDRPGQRPG
jgi:hypothetical protein